MENPYQLSHSERYDFLTADARMLLDSLQIWSQKPDILHADRRYLARMFTRSYRDYDIGLAQIESIEDLPTFRAFDSDSLHSIEPRGLIIASSIASEKRLPLSSLSYFTEWYADKMERQGAIVLSYVAGIYSTLDEHCLSVGSGGVLRTFCTQLILAVGNFLNGDSVPCRQFSKTFPKSCDKDLMVLMQDLMDHISLLGRRPDGQKQQILAIVDGAHFLEKDMQQFDIVLRFLQQCLLETTTHPRGTNLVFRYIIISPTPLRSLEGTFQPDFELWGFLPQPDLYPVHFD